MNEFQPFQIVLDALLDESQPFPPRLLYHFSDISPDELVVLMDTWPQVSLTRQRALLEDIEDLAEVDTLLSFDDFARVLLNDPDERVRMYAIRLLWQCEDEKLVPEYIRILTSDPEQVTRATAATALGHFIYLGEIDELEDELWHEVEEHLLDVAKNSDDELIQRRALEALGFSARPELPPLIEKAYASKDTNWVVSALFAMGRSSDTRWSKHVMKMFSHGVERVREEAVRAAGELALKEAREPLLEMLAEEDEPDILMALIWTLSQIGGEGIRATLENYYDELDDPELLDIIDEALDNLTFTEDMDNLDMFEFDVDEDDEESL